MFWAKKKRVTIQYSSSPSTLSLGIRNFYLHHNELLIGLVFSCLISCSVRLTHCCYSGYSKVEIQPCHFPAFSIRHLKSYMTWPQLEKRFLSFFFLCSLLFAHTPVTLNTSLALLLVSCTLYFECLSCLSFQQLPCRIQPKPCLF